MADLNKFLQEAAALDPRVETLVAYLQQKSMVPNISIVPSLGGSTGQFEYGQGLPPQGTVSIIPRNKMEDALNTLSHELTHASERQILGQLYDPPSKGGELIHGQFQDAYDKLYYKRKARATSPDKVPRKQMAERLDPKNAKEEYRGSMGELAAFGVGNSGPGEGVYKGAPHLDPTMATEFMILLDLASRSNKVNPKQEKK